MAWAKLATNTLSVTDTKVDLTISEKKFLQSLYNELGCAYSATHVVYQFNSDSGSNYATRWSNNGGVDGTSVNNTYSFFYVNTVNIPRFIISYTINISAQEKLTIGFEVEQNTAGAGTAPNRAEVAGKWANTSSQITSTRFTANGSDTIAAGSNSTMLGTD